MLQTFFAPHTKGKLKWGLGPQFSFKTRTDSDLGGPSWGAGIVGVVVTNLTTDLSLATIVGNHWSFNGDFNTMTIQPTLSYNFPSIPGAYINYNAPISADWEASSGDTWTVPLGLGVGKTFDMGNGHGLDIGVGPYYNVARPEGGARWQLRYTVAWLFP